MTFNPLGHDTPAGDLDALKRLARAIGAKTAVEIGAWAGQSTLALAEVCETVYSVDTWDGRGDSLMEQTARENDVYAVWRSNMDYLLNRKVFGFKGPSWEIARTWKTPVDLVFVDGAHDYESVASDIRWWWPFVKVGGAMAGHDACLVGVQKAIVESFGSASVVSNIWWRLKPLEVERVRREVNGERT